MTIIFDSFKASLDIHPLSRCAYGVSCRVRAKSYPKMPSHPFTPKRTVPPFNILWPEDIVPKSIDSTDLTTIFSVAPNN